MYLHPIENPNDMKEGENHDPYGSARMVGCIGLMFLLAIPTVILILVLL